MNHKRLGKVLAVAALTHFMTGSAWAVQDGYVSHAYRTIAEASLLNRMSQSEDHRVIDVAINNGAPAKLTREAFEYFDDHQEKFPNDRYMTVIDMSRPSSEKRMYLINLKTGAVERQLVSHGNGSGELMARRFSNTDGSHMTSVGFYKVNREIESPKHGRALELVGLSRTNSNALDRAIIMHGGYNKRTGVEYVSEEFVKENGYLGRSQGCPAIERRLVAATFPKVDRGSLLYIYGGEAWRKY